MVKGYELDFTENPRRGRLAVVHPSAPRDAPAAVRNARESSLQVKGSMLFNLIPLELRGMSGPVDQFKNGLDRWLSNIRDQPTISSRQRAAKTNSLLDQVPLHQHL